MCSSDLDTNHDVFTFGFGGAAIGMVISGGESASSAGEAGGAGLGAGGGGFDTGAVAGGGPGGAAAVPSTPGSTMLQLPAPASGAGKSLPRVLGNSRLASARSHGGIGGWWFLLLALAAVAGAVLLSRVPALLTTTAAASTCAHERTTPNRRP